MIDVTETFAQALARGDALLAQQQFAEALTSYQEASMAQPHHPTPPFKMANLLFQLGQFSRALTYFDAALALAPDWVEAMHNRAATLQQLGRYDEALGLVSKALARAPEMAVLHHMRGSILQSQHAWDAALDAYGQAVARDAQLFDSYLNMAGIFRQQERIAEALACSEMALKLRPDSPDAATNYANALCDVGRFEEALAVYDAALKHAPNHLSLHLDRSAALHRLGRVAEALAGYEAAVVLAPDSPEVYGSIGAILQAQGRHDEAGAAFAAALRVAPDSAFAQFNLATHRLLLGDFAQGWRLYEARWRKPDRRSPPRAFAAPLWLGDGAIKGKTLLLHAEQGLGDAIQFCRYATVLAVRGARVILEIHAPLASLARSLAGGITVVARGEALPPFDFHCPLMSLPLACGTTLETIPNHVPYLAADAQKIAQWRERLGERKRPRIGLVWSGAAKHKNDAQRSMTLPQLAPLWSLDREFHCLQQELRACDAAHLPHTPVAFHGAELRTLDDTAALMMAMDAVVAVDTSMLHLAGALGLPVLALLPFAPDHRWMLVRADSPWYPTATLIRQEIVGDWAPMVARAAALLAAGSFASAGRM